MTTTTPAPVVEEDTNSPKAVAYAMLAAIFALLISLGLVIGWVLIGVSR